MSTMSTQSLCGSFLGSRRSLVAFAWTVTTVLTLVAFVVATAMMMHINSHYRYLQNLYGGDDDNNDDKESGSQDYDMYALLASTSSRSMAFVAVYTMLLTICMISYGSTAIVGFMSVRGHYIAPCFSSGASNMRVGMFGGALVTFAGLLLLCAVIFGEFRVDDYQDDREKEDMEPYAVERISTVLAVTSMFLSVLYTIFAVLLFLCSTSEEAQDGMHNAEESRLSKPLATMGDRDSNVASFITMDDSN